MIGFSNTQFIIESLIYIPTGQYYPMFARPYIVNANKEAIDSIAIKVEQNIAPEITPDLISKEINNIIQPSAVGFATEVNNDWVSLRKYIFLLKVKSIDPFTGLEINSYIQGYTEYDGITNTGAIDPKLVHIINSVIETVNYNLTTPLGVIQQEKLNNIYNVIGNSVYDELFTQRPTDVLTNIKFMNAEIFSSENSPFEFRVASNSFTRFDNRVAASGIDNNITSSYLTKIVNKGIKSNLENDAFVDSFEINNNSSNAIVPEPSLADNRFIRAINNMEGYRGVSKFFRFSTLAQIDPTIESRFTVINLTKDYVDPSLMQTPEIGDYWHGQDPVTVKAYSLIEACVSLATKYGFNRIFMTTSNKTNVLGTPEVFITNFNSFINLNDKDTFQLLELFKSRFMADIFNCETAGNTIPTHIEYYIDLIGTSKIFIDYAGFPPNWYTIPTFASSVFNPVITINKQALDNTCQELSIVINEMTQTAKSPAIQSAKKPFSFY